MNVKFNRDKGLRFHYLNPEFSFKHLPHYADAKVNLFRQGVIGFPWIFLRKQSDHDQYLVDKGSEQGYIQAPQNASTLQPEKPRLDEIEIPVKKFTPGESDSNDSEKSSSFTQEITDKEARDLPLYSPVSKSLFAHLQNLHCINTDWKSTGQPCSLVKTDDYFISHPHNVSRWNFSAAQGDIIAKHPNSMKIIQQILYNELDRSCVLRSSYSLLPYISFSPYSPLRLLTNAQNDPKDVYFPYCHAFQDLIETSFNQSQIQSICSYNPGEQSGNMNMKIEQSRSLQESLNWIQELYYRGILQQKENKFGHYPFQRIPFINWPSTNKIHGIQRELDERIFLEWPFPSFSEKIFLDPVLGGLVGFIRDDYKNLQERAKKSRNSEQDNYQLDRLSVNESKSKVMRQNSDSEILSNHVVSSSTSVIQRIGPDERVNIIVEHREVFADGHENVRTTIKEGNSWAENNDQKFITAEDRDSIKARDTTTPLQNSEHSSKGPNKTRSNWFWK